MDRCADVPRWSGSNSRSRTATRSTWAWTTAREASCSTRFAAVSREGCPWGTCERMRPSFWTPWTPCTRGKSSTRGRQAQSVLLDKRGHTLLTDFGSCLDLRGTATVHRRRGRSAGTGDGDEASELRRRRRRLAFVGTCDYVPPEILGEPGGDEVGWAEDLRRPMPPPGSMDWWSFGCVVYQMLTGACPFRGANEFLTYNNIVAGNVAPWPDWLADESSDAGATDAAKDLVEQLLNPDPFERLGSGRGARTTSGRTRFRKRSRVGRGAKVEGGAGAYVEVAEELVLFGQLGVRLRDVRGRPRDERGHAWRGRGGAFVVRRRDAIRRSAWRRTDRIGGSIGSSQMYSYRRRECTVRLEEVRDDLLAPPTPRPVFGSTR